MKHKPGFLRQVKQYNMAKVLKAIWEGEPISRIELVDKTELTSGTITNLTQELIHAGMIRESESQASQVGRKRVMLRFAAEQYRLIGIDIGRASVEVVLTDLSGRIVESEEADMTGSLGPAQVLDWLAPSVSGIRERAARRGELVIGTGLSIPGPMNHEQGMLLDPPNFPGWERVQVRAEIEKRLGVSVVMNDNARASALAERWFGLGRAGQNLVHITMDIGIGGGVIADGEIVHGYNGLYGQVGHMTVVPDGELCACGNWGCWETVGSIPAILRHWHDRTEGASIADFFRAAENGEAHAERRLEYTLQVMDSTLTTLFNLYDPEIIVFGGRLMPHLSPYMKRITSRVQARVYAFAQNRVVIAENTFGASQSAVGAASLVFGKMMEDPLMLLDSV